jgi:murein DD-endopeptidase MepM/ murein hydrolase activator NlpD
MFVQLMFNQLKIYMNTLQNIIKKTVKGKNRNKIMTLGYAVVVVTAFIVSLANNSDVSASISRKNDFEYMELKSRIDSNFAENLTLAQDFSVDNIRSLFGKVNVVSGKKDNVTTLEVKSGDTFIKILTSSELDISYNEANEIVNSLKGVYNVRNLKIGQKIFVTTTESIEEEGINIKSVTIRQAADQRVIVDKNDEGRYVARKEKDELLEEVNTASGVIDENLSVSMNKLGVPKKIVSEFINVFAFSIDFRRDVHSGDKFEIIYENYINNDGELIRTGDILYAALYLRNDKIALYRFESEKGGVDYYNEKGLPMKKTLHRKPLDFPKARISSHYGKRRHPILKQTRIHWGVDYAAPRGTAVFAAGDGVVQVAKYNGGYGKYIKIRHNSEYSTAYGHLNGYAKGIAQGTRVKQGQVIGYVGNTGRSTGPHLHYEVIQGGRRVNPLHIKASTGENLKGKDFEAFKQVVASVQTAHPSMFASVASAPEVVSNPQSNSEIVSAQ